MNWTDGYVAELDYLHGYYSELNPLRMRWAFLAAGIQPPRQGYACELGFGQGMSINIHAAAGADVWYGTDFNPAQAGNAQALALLSDSGAKLSDQAFAEFCSREDLPDFDSISLHGIWSWITDENRHVIVNFVRRRLKVGGVLYVSYNTLPGWSSFAPLRHLMKQHSELMSAKAGGIVKRIDGALSFAEQMLAANPAFARASPQIADRLKRVQGQNRHYVAHEYFNDNWHPMFFSGMCEWLMPAKLTYACSAHLLDAIDGLNLLPAQQAFLSQIPDDLFRQSVRDFMVNQQFRRDYWVKGVRRLSGLEQMAALRAQRLLLITHRPDISTKLTGAQGEASMSATVYTPILDLMADHQIKTFAELEQGLSAGGVTTSQLLQAIQALAGNGHIAFVQEEAIVSQAKPRTAKLNGYLLEKARSDDAVSYLASPVSGGGVPMTRFEQLFLLALAEGKKQSGEWATLVWQVISGEGRKMIKDGKTLETREECLAEIGAQAEIFANKNLPILRTLQVI